MPDPLQLSRAFNRRKILQAPLALACSAAFFPGARAETPPEVKEPRQTSGDRVEPNWAEQLTVTVGTDKGDIVGSTERALQAAVDYVARFGGGTVRILPGRFRLRNSVYLPSGVRIQGSGEETVLFKEPSHTANLAEDSDWYEQEITLKDAGEFKVGDGICLRTKNPHNGGTDVVKRTLVARDGNRFKLDRALRNNFWLRGDSTVSTLFPLITGEFVERITIEDLALDGNKENNDLLDGNYAGCLFFQDCRELNFRRLTTRNYNGDGISWQICHDVVVEECHSHDNANLGLHPGSGSQRPVIRNNRLEGNDIGIFFCWGVKYGLAEGNQIRDCKSYGVSIGHRDTDNVIVNNDIRQSGKIGVYFRAEQEKSFSPHRNRVEGNRIYDNGPEDGVAIDVQGFTESITVAKNDIQETRSPGKRIGVRIGKETQDVRLDDNKIAGFAREVVRD